MSAEGAGVPAAASVLMFSAWLRSGSGRTPRRPSNWALRRLRYCFSTRLWEALVRRSSTVSEGRETEFLDAREALRSRDALVAEFGDCSGGLAAVVAGGG